MTSEICPTCGLPKDICTCQVIEREAKKIKIYVDQRKYRKPMTVIEGVDESSGKALSKEMKRKLACGGTFKEGRIELQGNHKKKAKELLIQAGYSEDQIEVS